MSRYSRTGYTQAIANLSSWKFIALEILMLSIWTGAYYESVYAFTGMLIALLLIFLNRVTLHFVSLFISFLWALLGAMISKGLTFWNYGVFNSLDNFINIFSTPLPQMVGILIFIISYIYHISIAELFRDILSPIVPNAPKFMRKHEALDD